MVFCTASLRFGQIPLLNYYDFGDKLSGFQQSIEFVAKKATIPI
jgi:hypothetical protein